MEPWVDWKKVAMVVGPVLGFVLVCYAIRDNHPCEKTEWRSVAVDRGTPVRYYKVCVLR